MVILGLYRDNGKENWKLLFRVYVCCAFARLGRKATSDSDSRLLRGKGVIVAAGEVRCQEIFQDSLRQLNFTSWHPKSIMEKKMETAITGLYWGYIGMMEKKMEATILGLCLLCFHL